MSDQIDVNQLSNALQQKVDLPSGKSQADIDYVIECQRPTAENNYTWYRLYKSGWIEQGGRTNVSSQSATTSQTINLIKTMQDTNFHITLLEYTNSTVISNENEIYIYNKTTNSIIYQFTAYNGNAQTFGVYWEVKGFTAQS